MGSLTSKCVILDGPTIIGEAMMPTGKSGKIVARKVLNVALEISNIQLSWIDYIIATGYGRIDISFQNKTVT